MSPLLQVDHQLFFDVDLADLVPLEIADLLQALALLGAEVEIAGAEEPQVELDGPGGHNPQDLHAPQGIDLAGRAHEGHPVKMPPVHVLQFHDGGRIGGIDLGKEVHAGGGVEMEARGLDDLLPGGGQPGLPLEGAGLPGDDGAVDAPQVEEMQRAGPVTTPPSVATALTAGSVARATVVSRIRPMGALQATRRLVSSSSSPISGQME